MGVAELPDAEELAAFADALAQHKENCEANGKYDEAELARRRIVHVRRTQERRVAQELKSSQRGERMQIEEAHVAELRQMTAYWDGKQAEYEGHARYLEAELKERQKAEHEAFVKDLRATMEPRMPRWSRDLLNVRSSQEHLKKQKKFTQALKQKAQGDEIELKEYNVWLEARERKLAAREERFLEAQRREGAGLAKRIQVGRDELRLSRRGELERLLQRHQNATQALQSQQKILRHRVAQSPKNWMHVPAALRPASAASLGTEGAVRRASSAASRPSTAVSASKPSAETTSVSRTQSATRTSGEAS